MDRIAACKVYKGAAYKDSDPLIYYNSGKAGRYDAQRYEKLLENFAYACGTRERQCFAMFAGKY